MKKLNAYGFALRAGLAALPMLAGMASAQVFDQPAPDFNGSVSASQRALFPGSETGIEGSGFKPGQKITLLRGETVLNPQAYVADAEGRFSGSLSIPADAVAGTHPIVVRADDPDAASILELKISKVVPLSGHDRFDATANGMAPGLYQVAYSAGSKAVFVTSAFGLPPIKQSALLKVDPQTLKILASVTPQAAPLPAPRPGFPPAREGGVYAVYGVGVDDANGTVWVTNTRQDTVAVYRQADLSLVKQFPVGAVPHARDVVIDAQRSRAYASAPMEGLIAVFDTKTLEQLPSIAVKSAKFGKRFAPASLALDAAGGKLYTPGLQTSELAIIDLATNKVDKVIQLPNVRAAIGVAWNPVGKRVLVAAQGSDNLLVVNPRTGNVEHDVYVGAGALNVAYDAVNRLAYVSSPGAGTITVVDDGGKIVANLDGGTLPNHLSVAPGGVVFAVNKAKFVIERADGRRAVKAVDDPKGDRLTRLVPKLR